MDFARGLLNGGHQHDVDQPDDGSVLALTGQRLGADLLHLVEDFDAVGGFVPERRLQLLEAAARHLQRAAGDGLAFPGLPLRARSAFGARVVLLDRVGDRDLRRDDRLHRVAGHELDVVHREDVGRIRHRDRERAARAAQRNDLVLAGRLGRHQLDDGRVDLELGEVDRGDAVLLAEQRGNLLVLHEPHLDEVEAELAPVALLLRERLLQLLGGNQFLLEEEFAYSDGHEAVKYAGLDKLRQELT